MCSLFGLIDFNEVLTTKKKNKILNTLATVCECRGTDATGIAYNINGKLKIYKRPVPAHKLNICVPDSVKTIMGHTRMTTQGNAKHNHNNHPFSGYVDGKHFAFAHNGVLYNDLQLRLTENLPVTNIETDSYIAVQLMEKENALNFNSLKNMAEKVKGSFVFTVLDNDNSIWFVKGDNPLSIFYYDGFLIYASTTEILNKSAKHLKLGKPNKVYMPSEGDILKINSSGQMQSGLFIPDFNSLCGAYNLYDFDLYSEMGSYDELIAVASSMGISPDEIMVLMDYGCDRDEIEELLYDPMLLHEIAAELLYAY